MARAQADLNVTSTFSKGFVTESNRLSESENILTDGDNIEITRKGVLKRRLGIDIETGGSTIPETESILSDTRAVKSVVWKNVNGDPSTNFLIAQKGNDLHFFDMSYSPLSDGYIAQINLSDYAVNSTLSANEPISITETTSCAIIFNKYCDPIYVAFRTEDEAFEVGPIILKIRDFTGLPDGLKISERPTTLSVAHAYNLLNQGWKDSSIDSGIDYTGSGTVIGGSGTTGGGTTTDTGDVRNEFGR